MCTADRFTTARQPFSVSKVQNSELPTSRGAARCFRSTEYAVKYSSNLTIVPVFCESCSIVIIFLSLTSEDIVNTSELSSEHRVGSSRTPFVLT